MAGYRLASRLAVAAGTVILLASCGGEEPGSPTAASSTSADTSAPTSSTTTPITTPTTTSNSGSELDGVDPCEMLSGGDLSGLGLKNGQPDELPDGSPICLWHPETTGGSVSVTIRVSQGIGDLGTEGGKATDLTVGSHQARRFESDVAGLCDVDIAVTDSSSVSAGAVHNDAASSCDLAEQVATLIEPKLPRG